MGVMGSTKATGRAKRGRSPVIVALLAGLAGCETTCPFPGQERATKLEMFFGRDIPGGGRVDDTAWRDFTTRILTPAFPNGFTVFSATGQWLDPTQKRVTHEDSWVVLVAGRVASADVTRVGQTYRAWFHQESVGVVSSEACAAF